MMKKDWRLALLPLTVAALCAASSGQSPLPFTDEAAARGVQYVFELDTDDGFGHGVAFADLDSDGDDDIVLVGSETNVLGVFENDGLGNFTDRSDDTAVGPVPNAVGLSAADYDADGDIDLLVTTFEDVDRLLRNDGGFQFSDVTAAAGLVHNTCSQGTAWGDYDGDGWLDLYVSVRKFEGGGNFLYHNDGDGTFTEVGARLGVAGPDSGMTFHASFLDYNHDRLPDLYVCNDKAQFCTSGQNHLYENQGNGTFLEVTEATGTEACVACMGTAVGDFNADGHTDLYCTNLPHGNVLLMNQGDGTYLDESEASGTGSFLLGWGNIFFDYDNDTYLDLYVCNLGPNRLYENDLTWPCPDVAPQLGVAPETYSICVASSDIDRDGDLDLLVQALGVPVQLFVNHEGELRNWLQVETFGANANTRAIGARVVVATGSRVQYREVRAGTGFKSANSLVMHFGLDAFEKADEVRVEWPSGRTTVLENVAVNQRITVNEPVLPTLPRPAVRR